MRVRASTLQRWARFVVVLLAFFGPPARAADPSPQVAEPRRSLREIERERDMIANFVLLNALAAWAVVRFALDERERRRRANPNRNHRTRWWEDGPPAAASVGDPWRVVIRSPEADYTASRRPGHEEEERQD